MVGTASDDHGDRVRVFTFADVDEFVISNLYFFNYFCFTERLGCYFFRACLYCSACGFGEFLHVAAAGVLDCHYVLFGEEV